MRKHQSLLTTSMWNLPFQRWSVFRKAALIPCTYFFRCLVWTRSVFSFLPILQLRKLRQKRLTNPESGAKVYTFKGLTSSSNITKVCAKYTFFQLPPTGWKFSGVILLRFSNHREFQLWVENSWHLTVGWISARLRNSEQWLHFHFLDSILF